MGPAERALVTIIGGCYLGMSTQLAPPYYLADLIDSAPLLWEVIFATTGTACVALALRPRSRWLPYLAGAGVMLAAGSRGVALFAVAITDPAVSLVPVLGWTMVLAMQVYLWPHLAPRPPRRDRR